MGNNPLAFLTKLRPAAPSDGPVEFELNAHVHIPPNFSSIPDAETAARRAAEEGVQILGISNYYGTDSYGAFGEACLKHRIFPLFGLEVIVFDEALARAKTRVNDPQNPGKIYICGKGLGRIEPTVEARTVYAEIAQLDNVRAVDILAKANAHAERRGVRLGLEAGRVAADVASRKGVPAATVVLQERYLAEAVARALDEGAAGGRRARWLAVLGDDAAGDLETAWTSPPAERDRRIQDLVRKYVMKVGRPAHVEERYVSLDKARRLFAELDGVTVYPVLADGASPVCEFENDPASLADRLESWGIRAVEFIPTRNAPECLMRYIETFAARGFFMTAGTEHNTPGQEPIAIRCRGGAPLPPRARTLFSRGACILAAQQFLRAWGDRGLDDARLRDPRALDELAALGAKIVQATLESSSNSNG